MNYSHFHVFTKSCAATLSLPKIIDLSLSLCVSPALLDRKTRITPPFVKIENNKIPEIPAIIDLWSLAWSRRCHACHVHLVRLSINNSYSYLNLSKTIRMRMVLNNLSFQERAIAVFFGWDRSLSVSVGVVAPEVTTTQEYSNLSHKCTFVHLCIFGYPLKSERWKHSIWVD